VVDEEVEAEDLALAKTVRTPARENIEVLHEVEPFGNQALTRWGGGEFHEVEMPAPVSGVAAQCERVRQDGRMYLVLTGKHPEGSMKRPLDVCDAGSIVDILEIWMFRYGKPAAICTDEGPYLGGLFRAWCGYRSIEQRIYSWP
jgi:hypothetical protein